jgi:hypothetical protein
MVFRINKLKLSNHGSQEAVFDTNLLFIYGTTATGKTLIAELISYGLGQKSIGLVNELRKYDFIYLEIETNSGPIVIKRDLKKQSAGVMCFNGNLNNYSEASATKLNLAGSNPETQFSWYLLEKMKIPIVKSLPENMQVSSKPSLISFRDIFQFSYLSQNRIDSSEPLGLKKPFEYKKGIAAFELLFKINPSEIYEVYLKKHDIIQKQGSLEPKIKYLNEFLKSYDFNPKSLIAEIRFCNEEIKKIKDEIEKFNFNDKVIEDNIEDKDSLEKITQIKKILASKNNEGIAILETISNWEKLYNTYRLEEEKLSLTARATEIIDSVEYKTCPSCYKNIPKRDERLCLVCGQEKEIEEEDDISYQVKVKKIRDKQNELFEKIQNFKDTYNAISNEISQLKYELKNYENNYINSRKIVVDPKIEEYKELCIKLGNIESNLKFNHKLMNMYKRLRELSIESEKYKREIENFDEKIQEIKTEADKGKINVIQNLGNKLKELIKSVEIPERYKDNITISSKDYMPYVNGEVYTSVSSGGLKVYFSVAYFLSLLETALEIGNNFYPNLVIIDSIHKNISTQDPTDKTSVEVFFKKIAEIEEKYKDKIQIIILDNEIPEFVEKEEKFKKWHFTREDGINNGFIKEN